MDTRLSAGTSRYSRHFETHSTASRIVQVCLRAIGYGPDQHGLGGQTGGVIMIMSNSDPHQKVRVLSQKSSEA